MTSDKKWDRPLDEVDRERIRAADRRAAPLWARQTIEDALEELGLLAGDQDELVAARIEEGRLVLEVRHGPALAEVVSNAGAVVDDLSSREQDVGRPAPWRYSHLSLVPPEEPEDASVLMRLAHTARTGGNLVRSRAFSADAGPSGSGVAGSLSVSNPSGEEWAFEPSPDDDGFLLSVSFDGTPIPGRLVVTIGDGEQLIESLPGDVSVKLDLDFLDRMAEFGADLRWEPRSTG